MTDRAVARHRDRYERPTVAESFRGPRSMEDLPLYLMTRKLLRKARKVQGREFVFRTVERPGAVDGQLEERVPQFFLRNIRRVERTVDEDQSPFVEVRTRDPAAEDFGAILRGPRYERPRLLERWNLEDVMRLRALLKRLFFQEDWRTRFGRELKERIQGPIWRYEPPKL